MKNDFIEFYGKHNISPVRQDISNLEKHYERRKKLYKHLGMPVQVFKNAEVLEVGPGGGYNTLAYFYWGVTHIDLVEGNPKGIHEMRELFTKCNVSEDKYDIISCMIENYQTDKKYDVVIAEGFIPSIYNQKEVIGKLKELVKKDGIIVITCIDYISIFIENMKRMVGSLLSARIEEYNEKLKWLVDFFGPQLTKLEGVTRSAEDWVLDNVLNPATSNGMYLSLIEAMDLLGEDFEVLGTSQHMFTDYSWYKDLTYDIKADYRKQFCMKRYSLLMANMPEVIVSEQISNILDNSFKRIDELRIEYLNTMENNFVDQILMELERIENYIKENFDKMFVDVFMELKEVLANTKDNKKIVFEEYGNLFAAFGRGQQYISFVRK